MGSLVRAMPSTPSYLVLVPYYSNPAYLEQTLRSVIDQRDPDWRAVVVDDSIEGGRAQQVVDRLADERITCSRNDGNLGLARSFNRCFQIADEQRADLAMILHGDDLLERDYVGRIKAVHAEHPTAVCVAPGVLVIDGADRPSRTVPDTVKNWLRPRHVDSLDGELGLERLLRGQFFYCPSVSYRVGLLRRPAWNDRWRQVMDLELYARVLLDGGEIRLEPAQLFRYRRHESSMTALNSASMVRTEEETSLCRELVAECVARGWNRAARSGRLRITVRLQAGMRSLMMMAHGQVRRAARAFGLAVRP